MRRVFFVMRPLRFVICAAIALGAFGFAQAAETAVVIPKLRGPSAEIAPEDKGPRRLIRFLTSSDYPPFQFLEPGLNPAGLNVDLARALCDGLEFPCTIQALPWDELLPALEAGKADALIAGFRPSAELRARAELTRPYFRLPARFVVRKNADFTISAEGLEGRKIAVVGGSAHEAFLKAFFPKSELVSLADNEAVRAALTEERADALFGDAAGLSLWLGGTASKDCCAFSGGPYLESHFFGEGLSVLVRKGEVRLRQDIDRMLDDLDQRGVLADLYLRWFPIGIF